MSCMKFAVTSRPMKPRGAWQGRQKLPTTPAWETPLLASMSSPAPIRFGTDGWRGVIARDFTFDNVARVAEGVVRYLESQGRLELECYRRWRTTPADPHRGVVKDSP